MDSRLRGDDNAEVQALHPAHDPGSALRFVRDDERRWPHVTPERFGFMTL
jgi:hypothetical protein